MALKVDKHIWQPDFLNEIWITDERKQDRFLMTLKQGCDDVEIEFDWDYGYGGRGNERMSTPIQLLKDLISELE